VATSQIVEELSKLLGATLAKSSQQVYRRAWVLYREFSQSQNLQFKGLVDLPIHKNKVAAFIAYLRIRGFAPTTVISYTTALGYVHKMMGISDPIGQVMIQKLLSAVTKLSPSID
jgi:hypothetical protein